MGAIYCLYSTRDGSVRYVAGTSAAPEAAYKQHLTTALENEDRSPVYVWIREVLRAGFLVDAYTLQQDVSNNELTLFETYWAKQFPDVFNALPADARAKRLSPSAAAILRAIKERLQTEPDNSK